LCSAQATNTSSHSPQAKYLIIRFKLFSLMFSAQATTFFGTLPFEFVDVFGDGHYECKMDVGLGGSRAGVGACLFVLSS
jgi:hypothetical protein